MQTSMETKLTPDDPSRFGQQITHLLTKPSWFCNWMNLDAIQIKQETLISVTPKCWVLLEQKHNNVQTQATTGQQCFQSRRQQEKHLLMWLYLKAMQKVGYNSNTPASNCRRGREQPPQPLRWNSTNNNDASSSAMMTNEDMFLPGLAARADTTRSLTVEGKYSRTQRLDGG